MTPVELPDCPRNLRFIFSTSSNTTSSLFQVTTTCLDSRCVIILNYYLNSIGSQPPVVRIISRCARSAHRREAHQSGTQLSDITIYDSLVISQHWISSTCDFGWETTATSLHLTSQLESRRNRKNRGSSVFRIARARIEQSTKLKGQ